MITVRSPGLPLPLVRFTNLAKSRAKCCTLFSAHFKPFETAASTSRLSRQCFTAHAMLASNDFKMLRKKTSNDLK
jgi:hypothetical protein